MISAHRKVKMSLFCFTSSSNRSLQISVGRSLLVMPPTKRVTPNQLSGRSLSMGEGVDALKLQFPPLPQEWKDRYVPGQMFKYQASLPKLPVPPLHQTLHKYIASIEPLSTVDELDRTKRITAEFGRPGGVGEKLQKLLERRAEEKDNWLSDWWGRVAYLGYRLPVVVHSSPGIGYPFMPTENVDQFARLATSMILYSMKWNLLLKHEAIPTDVWRKPLCMSQLDIYGKCRIPYPEVDKIRCTPISESKHIVVIRNGHFFRLDVLYECPDGTLAVAPSSHIIEQLHNIIKMSPDPSKSPVGALTTEHRDTWAKSRETLIMDPANQQSLDVIERASFIVCLDQPHPHTSQLLSSSSEDDHHRTILANNVLHGNGTQYNSANRWFDHAFQLFVSEEGAVGSLLEHSTADGSTLNMHMFILSMLKLGYDILGESSPVPSSALCPAEKLQWKISPQTAQDIQTAKKNIDSLVEDIDLLVVTFGDFGKSALKEFNVSPDSFIQNAVQLAYYKLHNCPTATYESASTRGFYMGRTDTVRSCTSAALAFVKTMVNPAATVEEKGSSMGAAIKAHSNLIIDGVNGQAVDRHLLGLRLIAQEAGMEIPDFFKDEAYSKSMYYRLSTSQLPTFNHDVILCFGAVVPEGYGVCYCPQDYRTVFIVSSFRSCPETDSQVFGAKLMESMREMQAVLVKAKGLLAKI